MNQATATITVTPYSVTYDSTAHTAAATATGVFNEDLSADLTLTGTTHTSAGTYNGDAWSFHDPNGNYADASGTVNDAITQRDLYVTANANSKTYGQTASDSGTITGVQASDGITASFSSAGDPASAPVGTGSYAITATLSDPNGKLGNYTIHETDATLTVNKAALTITAQPNTKTYDGTTSAVAVPIVSGLKGADSVTGLTETYDNKNVGTGKTLSVATYTVNDGSNGGNYFVNTVPSTSGVIKKAGLTITANNTTKTFGQTVAFAGTEFSTSGLSRGDSVSSVTLTSAGAAAAAAVGTYPIVPSAAVGTGLSNYTIGYINGTLTVTGLSWSSYGTIYVLDTSAGGAVTVTGNGGMNINGNLIVDSSSPTAISASGNATVTAAGIQVAGKFQKSGNATFSPAPATGAQVIADPLAGLMPPSGLPTTPNFGSKSVSGNSTATLQPGVYSQISLSGNANVTMAAGTYVIQGGGFSASGNAVVTIGTGTSIIVEGGGFSASGNAGLSGTNVIIFNVGTSYNGTSDGGSYGALTLSGNGSISLTPPSSGPYARILIFQPSENAKALTFSGNSMQGVSGMIYAPSAQIAESGNAQIGSASHPISMVVDTLSISGNAIANGLTLTAPSGSVAYTPAQIREAYGINNLAQDGTGQTIAIVDAYDDPNILQSVDAFDTQFGLAVAGPSLYDQYGPAASFLTVLNQNGQATSLPAVDPNGAGTDNWEVEEALDVEWAHAIAPEAQIILVEASTQSLSDLMASVGTAASQPGVSVVSMSWGFAEGQAVFAADEAAYDSTFNVPGVTFVASTGDYGATDPQYPAYSPNVVAVGGTSLTLNGDNSYNSETGWGYYSSSAGASIGSGGGISQYETEPSYQQGVQSLGMRTTPDVALVADPNTGAWIADSYNLDPSNPFQVVGGTSLSAPAWAGLLALVDQGRAAAGESALNSASPTEAQQALYSLPQRDYNAIASGSNGYSAGAGYNLVTGLGTPVANLLVANLVAYQGPGTSYSGPAVGPLQNASLNGDWTGSGGPINVFSVFDSFTVTNVGLNHTGARAQAGRKLRSVTGRAQGAWPAPPHQLTSRRLQDHNPLGGGR